MPCSIIAAGSGISASRMPMRIMPARHPQDPGDERGDERGDGEDGDEKGGWHARHPSAVHGAVLPQALDVGVGIAERGEDLARVLAEHAERGA